MPNIVLYHLFTSIYAIPFAYKVYFFLFLFLARQTPIHPLKPCQGIVSSRKPPLLLLPKEKQLLLFSKHSFFSVSASMSVIALFTLLASSVSSMGTDICYVSTNTSLIEWYFNCCQSEMRRSKVVTIGCVKIQNWSLLFHRGNGWLHDLGDVNSIFLASVSSPMSQGVGLNTMGLLGLFQL